MIWAIVAVLIVVLVGEVVLLNRRAGRLRNQLQTALHRPPQLVIHRGNDQPDGRLASMWALTLLEERRQRRLGLVSAGAGGGSQLPEPPDELGDALAVEVERIREEVGTPGSLEARLDPPVGAGEAALVLHGTRQLLGALVRHTNAYDLTVVRDGDQVDVAVVCSGWEGQGSDVDEDVIRLVKAVAPAGGDVHVDPMSGGRLQVTLRLPAA